jgi:hypothetical protein
MIAPDEFRHSNRAAAQKLTLSNLRFQSAQPDSGAAQLRMILFSDPSPLRGWMALPKVRLETSGSNSARL